MTETIPLSDAARTLREIAGGDVALPGYRELYARILDGTLPAERKNGRWHLRRDTLRRIAKQAQN